MPNITVHHLNHSRSDRILWLLEELGLPYTVKVHYRTKQGFAPQSLRDVSDIAKSPVLEIDGVVLTESGAITHALLSRYWTPGRGLERMPSETSIFWGYFSEGTLMLHLQPARTAQLGARIFAADDTLTAAEKAGTQKFYEWFQGMARTTVDPALAKVESYLARQAPGVGFSGTTELGEGDFMLAFALNNIAYGGKVRLYSLGPASLAWVDRMRARPAFQRAQQRIKDEEAWQRAPKL
ncbi:Glutathione S-transferase 3 [Vanrija pseudolonga]|uniref:Glutathione S-transferase 3 n=1 Tax=Vanrija pseudolonga TaxID=143232 RepID=A0AAF0YFE6_9TREE|nr:Glutathione S-transferase 3 [Vanrija pseudolonga]